ncbi:MAG: PEP-utilizing enzyme [Syntrophobacteraceae bacterium]|nr:PEP-utilizing enzyme [Syntrophobacteraceae bacterium]
MKVYDVVPALEFDPQSDFEHSPYWFLDSTHSVPPWTPMFGWFWVNLCRHGMQYGAEKLSLPTIKGWDWRFHRGGGYWCVLQPKSLEEMHNRQIQFRHAILPFIQDYDGIWDGYIQEMVGRYENLKALDLDHASNIELLDNFEETINTCRRMWEIHMLMIYGTYVAYVLFENMCRDLAEIDDTSPVFQALVTGFDNKVFQLNRQLWEFSQRVREEGLAGAFLDGKPSEIKARLEQTVKGRKFLKDFMALMNLEGWRMERMAEINMPTWLEEPTPPLVNIRQFLRTGANFNLDEERARLSGKRQEAEKAVLAKVPGEQRSWFQRLMVLAQKSGVFSEEHDLYLDLYMHALVRRSVLGIGRRFAAKGAIAEPDDVFFLIPDEIRRAGINPDQFDLRHIVERRKAQWQEWQQSPNPSALLKEGFDMDMAVKLLLQSMDPLALKVVVGTMPQVRPELKADLYGTCGSPGVAEGRARVILNEDDFDLVEEGEILVAAATSPNWTPVFSMIRGVIIERGAILSHAAVIGREYGIPVLMNVNGGTSKIRTGQRLKVDANLGVAFIMGS